MLRPLACVLIATAALAACRNETAPPRSPRPATRPAQPVAAADAAPDTPPPPPALTRVLFVAAMPVAEALPQNLWRVTVDVTLQNATAAAVSVRRADFRASYASNDGGVAPGVAPSEATTLVEGSLEPAAIREGRLVFELPAAAGGSALLAVRWAPGQSEPMESRHPVMVMPGIHPIPLPPPPTAGDAAVAPAPEAAPAPAGRPAPNRPRR